jgi:hypothetical protein
MHPRFFFVAALASATLMNMIDSLPAHITHIILHIGTNDLNTGTVHDAFTDIVLLITHVQHKRPGTILTLTGVLPRLPNGHQNNANRWEVDEFNRKAGKFNEILVNLVENHQFSGVGLVLHRGFRTNPATFLAKDGIHPNFRGVGAIAHCLKQYFLDNRIQTPRSSGTTGLQTPNTNQTTQRITRKNTIATQCQATHVTVGTQYDLSELSESRTDHYTTSCPPTNSVATQCDPPAARETSESHTSPQQKKTAKRLTRKRTRASPNQTTPPTEKQASPTQKQNTNKKTPTSTQALVTPTGKTLVPRRTRRSD